VSLINEALRKARQAASEHDSRQAEDPFRPARTYPSRRSGRPHGLLVVVLIAVATGALIASAVWWFFGSRQPANHAVVASHEASVVVPAVVPASTPTPAADVGETDLRSTEAGGAEAPTMQTGTTTAPTPALEELEPEPRPRREAVERAASPTEGERVFVVEADLGGTSLSLGYIVARRDNPFAEINGVEVYVGSEIEGFVVEAIEADRVVLRDDKGELILRVP